MGHLMRAFGDALAGRKEEQAAAQLVEALRVRACERCGLRFGGGEGAFAQHLDGGRCLPPHVFESVLAEVGGIWYSIGTQPRG